MSYRLRKNSFDYNGFWGRPVEAIGVRLFSFKIYFADRWSAKFILRIVGVQNLFCESTESAKFDLALQT